MREKIKIVLFNPKPRGFKGEEETILVPPFALLAIAAMLDKKGYNIKIIDANIVDNYTEVIKKELTDALCLGVTSMTGYQIQGGLEVSKLAKEFYPNIKVIWGGYHPSILPEQTVANEYIDYVVKGQGERTFYELVKKIEVKKEPTNVLGVVYKKKNQIKANALRPFEDINNFPRIPFHLINIEKYVMYGVTPRTIGYITSQGCPFSCGFCAELKVTQRRWSGLEAKRVLDDMEQLNKRYNITGIHIFDSNFFIDKKRVKEICKGIIEKKLNIAWGNVNLKANALTEKDEELWKLLEESNCKWVLIGAESGTQEILNFINKDARVEDTIKVKQLLKKHNIRPLFGFVLGFPYPNNSNWGIHTDFKDTIKLIDKLMKVDNNNTFLYWLYTPYPGTPLYQTAVKLGFDEPKTLEEWSKFTLNFANIPWIQKKYERRLDQLNKFIFPYTSYHFDTAYDKMTKRKRLKRLFKLVHKIFQFTARLRWKYQFYSIPIEYQIIRWYRHQKAEKNENE